MMKRLFFYNFHFVFHLTRLIKSRFTHGGMLAISGLIAAGIFGIDTRQTLAYQLFVLLLVLLALAIVNGWFIRFQISAQRQLPKFITVGEPITYQMHVYNPTRHLQHNLSILEEIKLKSPTFEEFARVKDPGYEKRNWIDNYIGYPRWVWLISLSKGAQVVKQELPPLPPSLSQTGGIQVAMTLTPLRRGYIYFTDVVFSCPDPLGLFNKLYKYPLPEKLLVLPKRYPIKQLSLKGSRKYQRGGVHLAMSVGDSEEFVSLREYRPGDPLRRIHWKSLAKIGKPVVKEYQDEFFVRHALILDTFTDQETMTAFEAAVSVAASFACAPRSHEVLLDLMFIGAQAYHITSGRSLAQVETILETLACVESCSQQSLDSLYPLVNQHLSSLSAAICVLLKWDEAHQRLIRLLQGADIPLLVVVVNNQKSEIASYHGTKIHWLHPNNLATELEQISA